MSDIEDCGCNSNPVEITPEQVDNIKDTLVSTKDTLEKMLSSVEGMHFDVSKFDNLESEIKKISNFMDSGEFVNSIEKMLQRNANSAPINALMYQDFLNKKHSSFSGVFGGGILDSLISSPDEVVSLQQVIEKVNTPKTPIGYVYLDENGEQKFSLSEPEGITSTPVYSE